jgi:hypothetical protein
MKKPVAFAAFLGLLGLALAGPVYGIPSFARQTGASCRTCHTMWPDLTPFGRQFKLTGYTISKGAKQYELPPPVSAALQVSFTHTASPQPAGSIPANWATHSASAGNDVLGAPQAASLYYGGRIYGPVGAFVQGTFGGGANRVVLDMTDIRVAGAAKLFKKGLTYGLTINNSPTLQDLWNSTPAFEFPYATSGFAPVPATNAIVDGVLDQQVGGIGAYALWNDSLYIEGALYHSTETGLAKPLGAGTDPDTVVHGLAPYWRLVLQKDWGQHNLSAGTFGLQARIFPTATTSGPTDRFTDVAIDAQYQYTGAKQMVTVHALWIHEDRGLGASRALGLAANGSGRLDSLHIHGHYLIPSRFGDIGLSAAYFSTAGSPDSFLFSPDPLDGSRMARPNSRGVILESDLIFLKQFKASLQYVLYTAFNGARLNYDGSGRNASGNNTLYFLLWFMF